MEKGWKPDVDTSTNCPRCGSSSTKFCYYNNYSLTQPRYFCKACRRYWTKGGSLRNVPVGGGCRKNRRANRIARQATDATPSRNSPHGGATNNPIGHSYDPSKNPCSSSSVVSDAPNIDLAVVYANFLNQKPDSRAGLENPEIQTVFDPSVEYISSLPNTQVSPSLSLPEEHGFSGCLNMSQQSIESHFNEGNQLYNCEINSMQKHQEDRIEKYYTSHDTVNFELPLLPGEEAGSRDMMWSNSEMMVNNDLQATQPPAFGPEIHDPELLMDNWSPFDLAIRDASFFRP
ncbi:hypothetical protein L6164_033914 [Bauhinia variegata]|uniref:Uncharacterized protein n=1 Tax=Bauhinia variegata TaxID=167791 RepID=A0ACB9KT98_BAUVA|nr:hypothetical protein L6164_033914 [Bauhinia variegata]